MPEIVFDILGWVVYGVLAIIALWGAFCVVIVWRRVAQTRFRNEDQQEDFLDSLAVHLDRGDFEQAAELCGDDRRAMPQLALYAIENRGMGYEKVRHRVAERFQQDVLADIEHRLSWVATVIKSAPMIGLLGTVMGMMGAFVNLSSGEKVDTSKMAEDIGFALVTTACGLAIAIPLVLSTASINIRIRKMENLVGLGLNHLFESLRSAMQRGK
jgi:biopolymer transport protein ExbB/TolQ